MEKRCPECNGRGWPLDDPEVLAGGAPHAECPFCDGTGYVSDGDDVAPCDGPDCTYWKPNIKQPIPADATEGMIVAWHAAYDDYTANDWDRSHFG